MPRTSVDVRRRKSAKKALLGADTILGLNEVFKVLGDPTRLKIVLVLSHEELCVQDIAALLTVSESAISHQLRMLKTMRLVKLRRDGKMAYYSLDDEHIEDLIRVATRHIAEQ
jgi:ArsR family transcriptional regulator, lead/cadmium/zinc/bismuth-responsive transcriptional repressor